MNKRLFCCAVICDAPARYDCFAYYCLAVSKAEAIGIATIAGQEQYPGRQVFTSVVEVAQEYIEAVK